MSSCRVCNSKIVPFVSFGKMPIANGFLTADQFADEYFFELAAAFCSNCGMFQLIEQPAAKKMFHENYAFFSSTSRYMQNHFKEFAEFVMNGGFLKHKDPFVVELGSNDGIMLRHFKNAGFRHLGIEPSENVADVARSQGITTISEFFNLKLADRIIEEHSKADAVLAANVMCHIADINSLAAGIARLLKPDGVLIFEDPYLGDMIIKTSYDQIYDEHVFIFSATSVVWAFKQHGLELIDVIPQITHGGSMRYVLAPKGSHKISPNVKVLLDKEQQQGLGNPKTYDQFKINCETSRRELLDLLEKLYDQGKRVVGYGATSKSTTVMNYCGIGPKHIEFISDTTPIKQGKFSPGVHIPVKPYESFVKNPPEYALLFAWNHAKEIFEKEQAFKEQGGKWITFVPKVGVI
ncbi:MAG: methyltransferase domain-containing protein [Mobilitalea sp.]